MSAVIPCGINHRVSRALDVHRKQVELRFSRFEANLLVKRFNIETPFFQITDVQSTAYAVIKDEEWFPRP